MVHQAAEGRIGSAWPGLGMMAAGAILLAGVLAWPPALGQEAGPMLTRNTIWLSLAWYAAAVALMMQLGAEDRRASTTKGRLARGCWSWAVVCYLAHLAMAFEHQHHWSHAEAFEHTRRAGGFGEGIYASYLFTLLWIGDAAAWWIGPVRRAGRPAWIDRSLHAFMLFIIFNGTVVFGKGVIRWAGLAMFAGFAGMWIHRRLAARGRVA